MSDFSAVTMDDKLDPATAKFDRNLATHLLFIMLKNKEFPGRIRVKNSKSKQCEIELAVDFYYPDGSRMNTVTCADKQGHTNRTPVLFKIEEADDEDKKNSYQEHLVRVKSFSKLASEQALDNCIKEFNESAINSVVEKLQERLLVYEGYIQLKEEAERHIAAQVAASVEVEKSKLAARELTLTEGLQNLKGDKDNWTAQRDQEGSKLEQVRRELTDEKADFEAKKESVLQRLEQCGGERLWNLLQPILKDTEEQKSEVDRIDASLSLKEIATQVREALDKRGYQAEEALVRQAFLAICVAAATGQFVVLSGPPGSGKTSLTSNLAATLYAGYAAVPVRPAWIDPTDLLGFYNPTTERYQPTPFLDKLLEAEAYSNAGRLYFLVLDEMNLGRVENYAADFMAKLEKSHELNSSDTTQEAGIDLYSKEMYSRLRAKHEQLCGLSSSDELNNVAQSMEGCLLKKHLERYKPNIQIPKGLVLFGTINLDESTYHLSPKFLDRALVIQVSPEKIADPQSFRVTFENKVLPLARKIIPNALSDMEGCPKEKWQLIWEDVIGWDEKYLRPLGIRLSHRFGQTFRAWMNVACKLEIETDEAADMFFLTKLLPVIFFRSDEEPETVTITQENKPKPPNKKEVLEQWSRDESVSKYALNSESS